jgi:FixJ family two-component response regulator
MSIEVTETEYNNWVAFKSANRTKNTTIPEIKKQQIYQMIIKGFSTCQTAKEVGVSRTTVNNYKHKWGI